MVERKPKDDDMEGQDTGARQKAPDAGAFSETRLPRAHAQKVPISVLDKRRIGKEGEGAQAAEPDTKPLYVQQLEERVKRVEAAYKQQVAELQEETRRSRERILHDLDKRFQEKEKAMLLEVLELLDDLERACSLSSSDPKVAQGLALIASRAGQFLKSHGCRTLNPVGEPFDPNIMEAVAMQEGPAGTVVGVLQPGYLQGDALLRAARVLVGKGPSTS